MPTRTPPVTPAAHDEQVRSPGLVQQHLCCDPLGHQRTDRDIQLEPAHFGQRLHEGVLRVRLEVERALGAGRQRLRGRVTPRGHRLNRAPGQLRLADSPPQRRLRRVRPVDADNDPSLLPSHNGLLPSTRPLTSLLRRTPAGQGLRSRRFGTIGSSGRASGPGNITALFDAERAPAACSSCRLSGFRCTATTSPSRRRIFDEHERGAWRPGSGGPSPLTRQAVVAFGADFLDAGEHDGWIVTAIAGREVADLEEVSRLRSMGLPGCGRPAGGSTSSGWRRRYWTAGGCPAAKPPRSAD